MGSPLRAGHNVMGSPLRAGFRLAGFMVLTFALLPVQIVAVALRRPLARRLPMLFHRLSCRLFGFSVKIEGKPMPCGPTLFVCNHVSYMDIVVLGSLIPGSFIARADLADWPLLGLLAKLQRTIFIDRARRRAALHRDEVAARIAGGDDLILFPEGTSDDGNSLLPFKSALFAVAERAAGGGALRVQPVSIAYIRLDGMPIGRGLRPCYAWYGDMTLLPHLWQLLGLGRVSIMVEFHPPVSGAAFASRKALATHWDAAAAESARS